MVTGREFATCSVHHYSWRIGSRGCPRCVGAVDPSGAALTEHGATCQAKVEFSDLTATCTWCDWTYVERSRGVLRSTALERARRTR